MPLLRNIFVLGVKLQKMTQFEKGTFSFRKI